VSWYVGRGESEEGFLIADRKRNWWQVGMSKYAASIGAGWFIAYSGFAYEYGSPMFLVFIGAIAGVLVYAIWAVPKIRTVSSNAYTQGDFVLAKTNSSVARDFLNGTSILMTVLTTLIAIVGGATVLDSFNIVQYEVAVIVMVGVVLLYMLLSGFKAVMVTDVVQGILLLVLLTMVVVGLAIASPLDSVTLLESRNISPLGMTMLSVFGILAVFSDPTRFQLTFAGKSDHSVSKGMLTSIFPFLLTALLIYTLSAAVYSFDSTLTAAEVFPTALSSYVPSALVPLGFLVFFVALMSTSDSSFFALAAHTTSFITKNNPTKKLIRQLLIFYSILLAIGALLFTDVLDLAVLTAALLIVIAIPIIYLIAGGSSGIRFTALLAGGWIGVFVGLFITGLEPDAGAFVLLGFVVAALLPKRFLMRLA